MTETGEGQAARPAEGAPPPHVQLALEVAKTLGNHLRFDLHVPEGFSVSVPEPPGSVLETYEAALRVLRCYLVRV